MESSIYGTLGSAVEVTYFPYQNKFSDDVEKVEELDEIIDGVIFRVRVEKQEEENYTPEQEDKDYVDLEKLHAQFDSAESNVNRQLFNEVAQRTTSSDSYTNTFEISQTELNEFYDSLASSTDDDVVILKDNLKTLLTHDHACANIEAFVRDGLNVEGFAIDATISSHIKNAVYLSYLTKVISRLGLGQEVQTGYMNIILETMKTELEQKRKSQSFQKNLRRYRSELDNPVGVVDTPASTIGRQKSRM